MIDFGSIEQAAERIAGSANRTPVLEFPELSSRCKTNVHLKCENFQKIGAFKFRGACNAVATLPENTRAVATHSSGNHGAALALAASMRSIRSFVVMPTNAISVKRENVERSGGVVVECTPGMSSREQALQEIKDQTDAAVVHPFNDERVMAGQGTCALEFLREKPDLETLLIPVGGGGLLSGCAVAAKSMNPDIRIVAVEPKNADDTYRSFRSGARESMDNPDTIADGLKATVGTLTFPVIREFVDEVVTVSEEEIISATRFCLFQLKMVIEPSAATGIAAVLGNKTELGHSCGVIVTGGNIDLVNFLKQPDPGIYS